MSARQIPLRKQIQFNIMNIENFFVKWYLIIKDVAKKEIDLLDPSTVIKKRVAIVTGASRGLGLETVKCLLKYDYFVIAAVRDVEAMNEDILKLKLEQTSGTVVAHRLDLASQKSVEAFADEVKKTYHDVHLLVCNAGVYGGEYKLTEDGIENQMAVNYINHFYLTHLLTKLLRSSAERSGFNSRVVNVSSCGHVSGHLNFNNINMTGEYEPKMAYARSKLSQLLSSNHLDRLFNSNNIPIRCYSVNPGVVNTDMVKYSKQANENPWVLKCLKTPKEGAYSIAYCCLSADLENNGGVYIDNCKNGYANPFSRNIENQKKLFEISCEILKIENFGEIK